MIQDTKILNAADELVRLARKLLDDQATAVEALSIAASLIIMGDSTDFSFDQQEDLQAAQVTDELLPVR